MPDDDRGATSADQVPRVEPPRPPPVDGTMERRQPWTFGVAASALGSILVHVAVLALVLVFAGIRPFASGSTQAIAVDLVTPDELKPAEATPDPEDTKPEATAPDAPEAKRDLTKPEPAQSTNDTTRPQDEPQPQQPAPRSPSQGPPPAEQRQAVAAAPASVPAAPAFTPPEPDLTVKYGIPLGLPEAGGRSDFDDVASKAAQISDDTIAAFRRHLRTCSVMPDPAAISGDVWIKLRATFKPDGHLAGAPILIEGKASPSALALAKGAIAALQACQPYAMLPADKYNEWKVLDLEFTPADFHRG